MTAHAGQPCAASCSSTRAPDASPTPKPSGAALEMPTWSNSAASPGGGGTGWHLGCVLQEGVGGAELCHRQNEMGININELICTETGSLMLQPARAAEQEEGSEPGSPDCFPTPCSTPGLGGPKNKAAPPKCSSAPHPGPLVSRELAKICCSGVLTWAVLSEWGHEIKLEVVDRRPWPSLWPPRGHLILLFFLGTCLSPRLLQQPHHALRALHEAFPAACRRLKGWICHQSHGQEDSSTPGLDLAVPCRGMGAGGSPKSASTLPLKAFLPQGSPQPCSKGSLRFGCTVAAPNPVRGIFCC